MPHSYGISVDALTAVGAAAPLRHGHSQLPTPEIESVSIGRTFIRAGWKNDPTAAVPRTLFAASCIANDTSTRRQKKKK